MIHAIVCLPYNTPCSLALLVTRSETTDTERGSDQRCMRPQEESELMTRLSLSLSHSMAGRSSASEGEERQQASDAEGIEGEKSDGSGGRETKGEQGNE